MSAREATIQWWQLRSAGERRVSAVAAVAIAVAVLWLLAWQPLVRDSERLAHRLPADRAALADARRQTDAIAGLARSAPGPLAGDPRAALDPVLAARNLKGAATAIERIDNDRLRVTFDTIGFDTLSTLLDALQRDAHLRAVEVVATARVETGLVRADVTLTR
jgi:type II secretory pathway component PulM